jgi:uncharacterized protein (DUF305 family)
VIEPAAIDRATSEERAAPVWTSRIWPLILLLIVAAVAAVALWTAADRPPGDDSLEAGFARDMMVHHDQAVTMALLIRDRTDDPTMRTIATDMVLTQQHQIGQMFGWLNLWGLPATGSQPAMAWMGHPTTGLMPGMATPEEIAHLESLSGEAADVEFLRLMIRHHEAALPMAEAALQGSDIPAVRDLARQIADVQRVEIANMEALLAQKTPADGSS